LAGLGRPSTLHPEDRKLSTKKKQKVYFCSSNFYKILFLLHQLLNQTNHLLQLFKLCILPPLNGFEGGFTTVNNGFSTMTVVCPFALFISAESLKKHNKITKKS
jgi:hypothetical protein